MLVRNVPYKHRLRGTAVGNRKALVQEMLLYAVSDPGRPVLLCGGRVHVGKHRKSVQGSNRGADYHVLWRMIWHAEVREGDRRGKAALYHTVTYITMRQSF